MTTQQQIASTVLPSLSDCRRALDRVEVTLAVSVVLLVWAIVYGI